MSKGTKNEFLTMIEKMTDSQRLKEKKKVKLESMRAEVNIEDMELKIIEKEEFIEKLKKQVIEQEEKLLDDIDKMKHHITLQEKIVIDTNEKMELF